VRLELLGVLDQPVESSIRYCATSSARMMFGVTISADAEAGAVVGELVPREFRGDRVALVADQLGERRQRGHQLIGVVALPYE